MSTRKPTSGHTSADTGADRGAGTGGITLTGERIVRCPTCGGDSVYAASNPNRPFCSPRCRNVDFGAWAFGEYRVPTRPDPDDDLPQ